MQTFRLLIPIIVLMLPGIFSPALAVEPDDLVSHTVNENIVDLRTSDGALIRISFLSENLIRVQATTGDEPEDEGSGKAPIVLEFQNSGAVTATDGASEDTDKTVTESADISLQTRDESTHLVIATSAVELLIHRSPLLLELRRVSDGNVLWRELKPLHLSEDGSTQTLTSTPDERFFGGGQQNGTFEFKGRLMEISYSGGWEEGDRPSPAPFYMSDRGYGVLRNTWADGVYDFRSDRYATTTHAENRFDAYYMAGESIREILDLYTRLTGRARLLPRWAFGYGDADCYNDGDNVDKPGTTPEGWSDGPTGTTPDVVTSVAAKYREHDMPGGWILPNDGYGCGYVELPDVVTRLRELGFRTGLWTENGVEKIAWEVGTAGTRVQKLDVAWTGKGYQWAMDANHDAAQGFIDNSDARPFIWTVMGWAGIQRYAVTWTGDQSGSWDYIRWHVPTLIGSGLSGMNYSTGDVDGIFGGSPETFTRDLQWKCFTPVLMGMSGWSKAARKHPWWFDEPYRSINRRYLKLRQRLMPYIYTLARETETTGAPMVRGMMWDLDDLHAYDHPYQFLLGRDLLVAPVFRSQAANGGWREDMYLPEGRWIDYWSGVVLDANSGGRVVDVPVDLATLPVFVRAGAIIPMAPESLYDGETPADPLTLDVYPHGDSEFVLYEDDGNTRTYRDGAFSLQRFTVAAPAGGERIDIGIGPAEGEFDGRLDARDLIVELHTRLAPVTIALNDLNLPTITNEKELAAAAKGWCYDADDRFGVIHIKTGRLDTGMPHRLVVNLDPKGKPASTGGYPAKPAGDGTLGPDVLMVVGRPAEEPGHPLENAFDGSLDTWFRTVRDQRVAYGPHEFILSLGGRRVVEGFFISPRNDKYWKYGQVRHYEVYLADVNGRWGNPVATGTLEQTEERQVVRFPARAGRLLRFRVLSTHDDGADPMVLGVTDETSGRPYDAIAPVRVSPTTISEFRIIERANPAESEIAVSLAEVAGNGDAVITMNGLEFTGALSVSGNKNLDFALEGNWHSFRAEAGPDDAAPGETSVRFQVWGDDRLLWESSATKAPATVKPRLDIRGVSVLSLRTAASSPDLTAHWAEIVLDGYANDTMRVLPVAEKK